MPHSLSIEVNPISFHFFLSHCLTNAWVGSLESQLRASHTCVSVCIIKAPCHILNFLFSFLSPKRRGRDPARLWWGLHFQTQTDTHTGDPRPPFGWEFAGRVPPNSKEREWELNHILNEPWWEVHDSLFALSSLHLNPFSTPILTSKRISVCDGHFRVALSLFRHFSRIEA